ncbi:thioredoxin domain-containing protein 15 [Pantherophis guttatus]|uniref:Thioredoxin domain-containing protein 15 n=1 Tax=Pantherophis guttatus TaxID=94885 RepID=A0A6P9AUK7_PANGU|nr:thioredoxin domain-containing protein 15 [Pantherophis guttatus]
MLLASRGWGRHLGVVWLLAFLAAAETDETSDLLSEELSETSLPVNPESTSAHSSSDGHRESVQYRTAEIADAMMSGSLLADHHVVLSVIPSDTKETHLSEADTGTCDASADGECRTKNMASVAQEVSHAQEPIVHPAVVLEAVHPSSAEDSNNTDGMKTPKVNCEERNVTGITNFTLQILNISQDLMEFLNPNGSDCTLVLFYTPWCRFSANLAPHFNCLPRVFPTLHFLALDASQHSSLSTRFGTVAVPNILLFQGAKPMARFNHTDRTLETLKAFIFNQTGIQPKSDVMVSMEDHVGPLPSTQSKGIDWLLLFSLLFLISFIMYATIRTESIRWLIPGHDQEHQE